MHDIEAWTWTTPPVEFRIAPQDVQALLSCLYKYQRHIEGLLASLDEDELDKTMSKEWAGGLGYSGPARQYDFFRDLVPGFETSVAEHQPVILTWD